MRALHSNAPNRSDLQQSFHGLLLFMVRGFHTFVFIELDEFIIFGYEICECTAFDWTPKLVEKPNTRSKNSLNKFE